MKRPAPDECTLKSCTRKKDGVGALLCPAHWALTPRPLRIALWKAEKLRSLREKEFQTMCRAGDILDWLETNVKIDLPPEVSIARPESEIETPKDQTPRIIRP